MDDKRSSAGARHKSASNKLVIQKENMLCEPSRDTVYQNKRRLNMFLFFSFILNNGISGVLHGGSNSMHVKRCNEVIL